MLPKSWFELMQGLYNRRLISDVIVWDGEKESDSVEIPLASRLQPVLIAVDNQSSALTATLEHLIAAEDGNASAQIGEDPNGTLTITVNEPGAAGNLYTLQFLIAEAGEEMSVSVDENLMVIFLGTDSEGLPDLLKNTAALIADYITENHGELFTATFSGDGFFDEETDPLPFAGGAAWETVTILWGNVKDLTGNRLSALQQVHAEIRSEVRFAWNKDVTDGMRIRHGERTLEIVGIPADPDGNKRDLVCTCREIRP